MTARTVAQIIESLLNHDGDLLTQLLPDSDEETEYALYNLVVEGAVALSSGEIRLDLTMELPSGEVTDEFTVTVDRVQRLT